MEFGNPIVGSEDLIRSAIKSPDFNTDEESGDVTGWRIAQDGSATFYNLVIGSQNYNIDENGNAVFQTVSASEIFLDGEELSGILDSKARGVLQNINLTGTSAAYTGTNVLFGEIIISHPDITRYYGLTLSNISFHRTSTLVDLYTISVYAAIGRRAVPTDGLFFQSKGVLSSSVATLDDTYTTFVPFFFESGTENDDIYFTFYFSSEDTGGGLTVKGIQGSSIWVEDKGPLIAEGTFAMGTGVPGVQQYTKTYFATNTASFESDGSNRGIDECYQGYFSSTNGNQFSLIQLDDAAIRSDLTGATILKTEVYLNNIHFYQNSGGNALIGTHNLSSISGNHAASVVTNDRINTPHYDLGQAKFTTVSNTIGQNLRDNTAKGLALGQDSSNVNTNYGYFAGADMPGPPRIRITYSK